MIPPFAGWDGSNLTLRTYLADDLVILQHAPGDVHTVVVPVGPRHVLIDIGVNARHSDCRQLPSPPTMERDTAGSRGGATE